MDLRIGNTKVIKYKDVYIKKETDNLTGSIKDRSAYEILRHHLDKNKTLVITTSGNMGISFSRLALYFKQPLLVITPKSENKKKLMENEYTKVIETNSELGIKGTLKEFKKYKYNLNYKLINQFSSLYNPLGYFPLVKEIMNSFKKLDYVICGIGTGGTFYTLSKVLKKIYPGISIYGVTSKPNETIDGIGSNYHGLIYNKIPKENIYEVSKEEALKVYKETYNASFDFGLSTCAQIALAEKLNLKGVVLIINSDGAAKYLEYL